MGRLASRKATAARSALALVKHSCTVELMQKRQKVLVIVGPTASGKSALAVELARKYNGEIISADSRQVYKGLDLGTGKITKREMKGVPHYLLDEASPHRIFTAHDFVTHATRTVVRVACRGKLPIVAGGTGFYIDALVGRIVLPNVQMDNALRERLEKKTAEQLFLLLKKRDPRRAKEIDRHNKRRLIRSLEIVSASGHIPIHNTEDGPPGIEDRPRYDVLWIGVLRDKQELEKLILARMRARMKVGMLKEARVLHKKGLSYKRMESLGLDYKFLALLLQKKISRAEFDGALVRESMRYAKRQMTYWKRNKEIRWFKPSQIKRIDKIVRSFVGAAKS